MVWALDFTPNKFIEELLSSQLGDEVVLVGVGRIEKAEELLSVMREVKAEEAVVAIEDPCEMSKLLDGGVQPLVAIVEEVCRAARLEECAGYDQSRDVVVEEGGGIAALRVKEFARVVDIMFQLAEPSEKHEHES